MQVLICYDVADNRLRRQLVKRLEKYAVRIQYSVFLGDLTEQQLRELNAFADKLLSEDEKSKFFIYKSNTQLGSVKIDPLPKECLIL